MKKFLLFPIIALIVASCSDSSHTDVWTDYEQWRQDNDNWINGLANKRNDDGSLYYDMTIPDWNSGSYVLMHYFNDRTETQGNLVPLYTSTVAVSYVGKLMNETEFDSSVGLPNNALVTTLGNVIPGWTIALSNMHVGDTCEVIIPYQQAYYANSSGVVPPFSCLQFNMKLIDIPYYEEKP